jgi:pyrroloquinoline quinone biosynthesis protein D
MLLYPEKGMLLNATGTAILQLCSGEHTLAAIIDKLAETYAGQPKSTIEAEVRSFLGALVERGLIEAAP